VTRLWLVNVCVDLVAAKRSTQFVPSREQGRQAVVSAERMCTGKAKRYSDDSDIVKIAPLSRRQNSPVILPLSGSVIQPGVRVRPVREHMCLGTCLQGSVSRSVARSVGKVRCHRRSSSTDVKSANVMCRWCVL